MDISIDEKRVYDASEGPTPVYVVGAFGVARVNTSDDLVGEFGLVRQCSARDAGGHRGLLAVATDEDVLVTDALADDEFTALEIGPAVAVGFDGDHLLVATEDGRVLRSEGSISVDTTWTTLGELVEVRAIDGTLVGAESGAYRATSDGLQHVGLEAVRDVSSAGTPLAATADGLYRLGNGWLDERSGDFHAVSAMATEGTGLGWAHAASESGLFAREDGDWRAVALPVESEVVALAHGAGAYAVTDDGTFLLSVGDGWTHQLLGLRDVRAIAAP